MLVGFMVNQVTLSITMFLFCINALWGTRPADWLRNKYWLLGIAWMALIACSYFWSADKAHWERSFQVKFPLFLFPLACGYMPAFSKVQLQRLTALMGVIFLAGIGYSLSFLVTEYQKYTSGYKWSVLLPTPCSQDHVRFSMALALYFIWCILLWPALQLRGMRLFIALSMAVVAVYLHILAAKSGLVALYGFCILWGVYFSFVKKKIAGLIIIVSIPAFLLFATRFIPTFSERLDYMGYAWTMLREGDRSGKYGDVNRLMSYKIATSLILEHPWLGVGAGDMMAEMKNGYEKYYPQVDDKARLLPHNQFLIAALGCGIPAMLLFTTWVLYPLTWLRRNRQSFFIFVTWLLLLFQLLIEPILEVQYGVFVYLFFLWWMSQKIPESEDAR